MIFHTWSVTGVQVCILWIFLLVNFGKFYLKNNTNLQKFQIQQLKFITWKLEYIVDVSWKAFITIRYVCILFYLYFKAKTIYKVKTYPKLKKNIFPT